MQTDGQYVTLDGGNTEIVPADNSKVVHTTGDETINGQKKFDTDPTDGAGNAYAKTVDVNQQLDKKVNIADMRKPASDVAGIEEVSTLQTQVDNSAVGTNLAPGTSSNWQKLTPQSGWGTQILCGPTYEIVNGETYTIQVETRNATSRIMLEPYCFTAKGARLSLLAPQKIADNDKKISITFTANLPEGYAYFAPDLSFDRLSSANGSYEFRRFKIEKGSVATDWCPNPEDKVNVSDMRKPASDVAGIEEVVHDNHDNTIKANNVNYDLSKTGLTPIGFVNSGSFNDLPLGTVFVTNSVTDSPNRAYYFTTTTFYFSGWGDRKAQIAIADSANLMYLRIRNVDNWTSWTLLSDDSKVVHNTDMRKPASDVAGIEEVNAKQDKLTITPADDSKVAHLSGANNFNTVPTVNNNPLLLASSLPSDLARTGQANTFNLTQTFSQGVKTLQTGSYDDANSLVNEGLYYNTNSSIKNGAASITTGYIQVMSGYGEIVRQIMYSDTNGGVMYDRTSQNGGSSWSNWIQIVTFDQIPWDVVLLDQDTNFTAKLQQNGQDVALANHTLARNPDTGKATDAIDFDPGKLTIGGNPAFSIVMCTNEADAKAKSAVNPNPIYVYPKES